jgi:fucose 4-O-acetylase-like acetyltransferase
MGLFIAGMILVLGLSITWDNQLAEYLFGIEKNTWYIYEAIVAFGLYSLGYFTYPYLKRIVSFPKISRLSLAMMFWTITHLTFQQNTPYETFVVILKESWHGSPLWFTITAISGTLALLLTASLIPAIKPVNFVGRNTLILLGMNGLFHTFLNLHVLTKIQNLESPWIITLISLSLSITTIVLSTPVILFLNRYLPQLVGKPQVEGPLLPALIQNEVPKGH